MLSISAGSVGKIAGNYLRHASTMRFPSRSTPDQASRMTARQFVAAAVALCFGLALGACSPFAGYVSDSWPHWAGGEPSGLPPRPGTPGYAEFIAHGQQVQNPQPAPTDPQSPAANETTQVVTQKPAATVQRTSIFGGPQVPAQRPNAQLPPAPNGPTPNGPASSGTNDDASVISGGLY
jgi:hypothetical protein